MPKGRKKSGARRGRRFSLRCGLNQVFGVDVLALLSDALAPAHANTEEVEPTITKTTSAAMILDTDHLLSND